MADVKRRRSRRAAGNFLTLAAKASRDLVESNYVVEFRFPIQIKEYRERRSGEPIRLLFLPEMDLLDRPGSRQFDLYKVSEWPT